MNGHEKSDPIVVAMKPANKAGRPVAEPVERRVGAKGNAGQHNTRRAQNRESVTQALARVRQAYASPSNTRGRSRMRAIRTYGSVRGALSNGRPYRDDGLGRSRKLAEPSYSALSILAAAAGTPARPIFPITHKTHLFPTG